MCSRRLAAALLPLALLTGCAEPAPVRPPTGVLLPVRLSTSDSPQSTGVEAVHAWVNAGTFEDADLLLTAKTVTPRESTNLLWAYRHGGRPDYLKRLLQALRADVTAPATPAAPDLLVLVNAYGSLRRTKELPGDLDAPVLRAIRSAADLLADPDHAGASFATAFPRAVALLLVHAALPDLDPDDRWGRLARGRLARLLDPGVAISGVEESPSVHVELLSDLQELLVWGQRYQVELPPEVGRRAQALVPYAAAVVWPDGTLPLVGASIRRRVGVTLARPTERARLFGRTGQAVLRTEGSQLLFSVMATGQRDALSFTYFAAGREQLPDSGLNTTAPGPAYAYFHGTSAHNTVRVDGVDQSGGPATPGLTTTGDGWAYQSGASAAYPRISHRRAVLALTNDLVLVVDLLAADRPHDYEQLWHLFPGAHVLTDGLETQVFDEFDNPALTITQAPLGPLRGNGFYGQTKPMQGWLSTHPGEAQPNHVVSYQARANERAFVTLLASGPYAARRAMFTSTVDSESIQAELCVGGYASTVDISRVARPGESVAVRRRAECPHGG